MSKFEFSIRKPGGGETFTISLETGASMVIVGANGSGKTRLGVYIENKLGEIAHRIPTHKVLALSDTTSNMSVDQAEQLQRYGTAGGTVAHRISSRWNNNPAVHLQNDFGFLLLRLFAEHTRAAVRHLAEHQKNGAVAAPTTTFDKLIDLWKGLLPHRALQVLENSIRAYPPESGEKGSYPGSDMSDGERAIFYFLGQCLVAPADGLIIIDEPEGHVHKAILRPLWDAIERARPDCAFIYITHDVDFVAARPSSSKYFIRSYSHAESWDLEELPSDTGLPEHVVAELVGSRKPILFVEGERGKLDATLYGHHYAEFTLMPIGSCDAVIHSVPSFNANPVLHHVNARGLVDADHRTPQEITALKASNVYALPVSEVENLLLLPDVFLALAEAFSCADPAAKLKTLTTAVMKLATEHMDLVSARYATRQIDRHLKRVTVKAQDLATLQASYSVEIASVDPTKLFSDFKTELQKAVSASDLSRVLALYDNKGLAVLAAQVLGIAAKDLQEKVKQLLGSDAGEKTRAALAKELPAIPT